jgi:hypothetical protein
LHQRQMDAELHPPMVSASWAPGHEARIPER